MTTACCVRTLHYGHQLLWVIRLGGARRLGRWLECAAPPHIHVMEGRADRDPLQGVLG